MADEKVHVLASTRMPDLSDPDDVVHGKRFVDPETGRPASMSDILTTLGFLRPAPMVVEVGSKDVPE